jgi:hypothetical protein
MTSFDSFPQSVLKMLSKQTMHSGLLAGKYHVVTYYLQGLSWPMF